MRQKRGYQVSRILSQMMVIMIVVASLIGCASFGKSQQVEDKVSQEADISLLEAASEDKWEVKLLGIREDSLTLKQFEEIKKVALKEGIIEELQLERKGVKTTYEAYPLKNLIARVDSDKTEEPFLFNQELWTEGYDITLTAADGYSATFSTKEVPMDALYFYNVKNGEPSEPGIIGVDVSSKYFIKDVASIDCALTPVESVKDLIPLEIVINGQKNNFSQEELKKTPYYTEGIGGHTTSAGTYYEYKYGGIILSEFLKSFVPISPQNSVTLIATDGFSMSYNFSELSNRDEGIWILAFEIDGEVMPDNPGPFRGVKIKDEALNGDVPNIDGNNSPKMVKRVEVSADVFKDFSLIVKGKMESTLDRATIQAGINCTAHKTNVEYFHRKSGETQHYTGIPLFSVLAFGDDPNFAPHKQADKSILAYDQAAAKAGYGVKISAGDGYSITLDSREIDKNEDVILAMYQDGEELKEGDWPLKLVWNTDAELIPEGIKTIKNIVSIELLF